MSEAERVMRFVSNLTLTEDYTHEKVTLFPFQRRIIEGVYQTDANGKRIITQVFIFLPRKSTKSQIVSWFGGYEALGSGKYGQEIICCAASVKQASFIFNKILTAIEASPFLSKRIKHFKSQRIIEVPKFQNTIQVISSEGKTQLGGNPSMILFDELISQGSRRELWDNVTSSFGGRKHGVLIGISTAGARNSLVHDEYTYACKVRDGVIEHPSYLPIIYEALPEDTWHDEATWHKAMPAIECGICNIDFIRSECKRALEIPSEQSKFRRFYLNQWVASESRFVNMNHWNTCGKVEVDYEALKGKPCYGGLDTSAVSDMSAFVLCFDMKDGSYQFLMWSWIPRNYAAERQEKDGIKYLTWADDPKNHLHLTSADVIDYNFIEETILQCAQDYKIKEINIDPWNCSYLAPRLEAKGLTINYFRQLQYTMNGPLKQMQVLLAQGKLHHGNNAILNWNADNAVVESDSNANLKLAKPHAKGGSKDKIDGLVAATMALAGTMAHVRKVSPMNKIRSDEPKHI